MARLAPALALWAAVACGTAADSGAPPARGSLDDVFTTEAMITLGEDPGDSIAAPGVFQARADGGVLLGDRLLPRVRAYDEEGRLEAAFGRRGDGPFEFRSISGLTETPSGRVVVLDGSLGRLTYLTDQLLPDTLVQLPARAYRAEPLGEDLLLHMTLGMSSEGFSRFVTSPQLLHRWTGSGVDWSAYRLPFLPIERPYWFSLPGRGLPFAVAGDSIYVAHSLRYPVAILNAAGDSVGQVGSPPATFREVPVFEQGTFSPGRYATQIPELLGGRNTIAHIAVLGSRLIITHGRYGYVESSPSFGAYHASLDVYDRHTGHKLYEDIPLPEGSQVLSGGRHLWILRDPGYPPWRIAKLSFRDPSPP